MAVAAVVMEMVALAAVVVVVLMAALVVLVVMVAVATVVLEFRLLVDSLLLTLAVSLVLVKVESLAAKLENCLQVGCSVFGHISCYGYVCQCTTSHTFSL